MFFGVAMELIVRIHADFTQSSFSTLYLFRLCLWGSFLEKWLESSRQGDLDHR